MAWDIDSLMWFEVRDKILKDRYAGCQYSMLDSFSPVVIRHRKPLPMKDRKKIQKLFPKWIRIEFQEVDYEGERVELYGRGNFIFIPQAVQLAVAQYIMSKLDKIPEEFREFVNEGGNWMAKGEIVK